MRTAHFYADGGLTDFSTAATGGFVMLQLQVDLLFLKHACSQLVKDNTEIDRLAEQCSSALVNRCCTYTGSTEEDYSMVNMLENVNGELELLRSVNDAIYKLTRTCCLFTR